MRNRAAYVTFRGNAQLVPAWSHASRMLAPQSKAEVATAHTFISDALAIVDVHIDEDDQHVDAPVHTPCMHRRAALQAALELPMPALTEPCGPLIERQVELAHA
jgi:hypothetical protein